MSNMEFTNEVVLNKKTLVVKNNKLRKIWMDEKKEEMGRNDDVGFE